MYYRAIFDTAAQNRATATAKLPHLVLGVGGGEWLGELMKRAIEPVCADLRFEVIPGCGHFVPEEAPIVQLVRRAARTLGREITLRRTGGASDANILFAKGIEVANLGTGQREVHTVREHLVLSDMVRSAELVLQTLRLHADGLSREPEVEGRRVPCTR